MDTQIARQNAHDVEPVTVPEISHVTRCGHEGEDSVQDDLVGQSVNGQRVLRGGREHYQSFHGGYQRFGAWRLEASV